ncbi:MAG: UDP-2,3-diacylglucosamine diphosphatase LpxI [Proteobacteria bacterium]|nr:UDP-2,3-diacylglucosamine diphosphatase LpxI [Pseudomonadota bacterium]
MFGLIAGQGDLPLQIIEYFLRNEIPFVCAGIEDAKNDTILEMQNITVKELPLGQIGALIDYFKSFGVKQVVFAGSVKRPNIFNIKFDSIGKKILKDIGFSLFRGDDGLLSTIVNFFEEEGFHVVSAKDILKDLTLEPGILTIHQPTENDDKDIDFGIHLLKEMSKLDIGQSVIIENGIVLGIEAIEGTKELIERVAHLKRTTDSGVLIKMAKVNQSFKIDLPTIGVETIKSLHQSNLKGIAIESIGTQVLDKDDVIQKANDLGIFFKVF